MPRRRKVGNPLGAAAVGLIIAGMGLYLVLQDAGRTPTVFGWLLMFFGGVGAVANLFLYRHIQGGGEGKADRRGR